MRTAELVVPALGYGIRVTDGYRVSVSLISVNGSTPDVSNCQKASERPSGLQRKPSRMPSSSSLTQSEVPLTMVGEPSCVS